MDEQAIIQLIKRRQAKFQAQLRPGPQEHMDETARLIVEEYDALLAEIGNMRSAEQKNRAAEAEVLGDQGQPGG